MSYDPDNTIEILQREWTFVDSFKNKEYRFLATPNIVHCTGFYGYDEQKQIAFMAHYDFPCSTGSLPYLFKKIKKHVGDSRIIYVFIFGGWDCCFWWSRKTREYIGNHLEKWEERGLVLEVDKKEFTPFYKLRGVGISLDIKNGSQNFNYGTKPKIRTRGLCGRRNYACKAIYYKPSN